MATSANSQELGVLVVVVLKAQNLKDRHSFYKQDVYAVASLSGQSSQTKVDKRGGQHPVWDEELRFPVMKDISKNHWTLEISCWSKEPKKDEEIGSATLDVTETLKKKEFDGKSYLWTGL